MPGRPSRRALFEYSAAALGGIGGPSCTQHPAAFTPGMQRPAIDWGIQIGDVLHDRAIVWSRTDRVARFVVEWSESEHFFAPQRVKGPLTHAGMDFTARVDLTGLPPGKQLFVRVYFELPDAAHVRSDVCLGRFRTAPNTARSVRFVWGGDTGGQNFGIDLAFGGMRIYEAMRNVDPDFFLHCGDNVYADGPMTPEVKDSAGVVIWKNAFLDVVPEKTRVAQTLTDYRRAYLYNRYDAPLRAFSAQVPQVWQWDDHEVANNWYRGRPLNPKLYAVSMQTLIKHGTRAFLEYAPMRLHPTESGRIYRTLAYGPLLDVFVLDLRSYRNANSCNLQPEASTATEYLGPAQLAWLKRALQHSTSTWKVIASDMPLGLRVSDGQDPSGCGWRWDNSSNQSGPVRGREFEIAELLGFIHQAKIANVVWLTADVHYAAAHFYDPAAAQFTEFTPFWEFVAGPLNAGTFGPEALDDTFGPRVVFHSAPPPGQGGLSPRAGLQFFGQVDLDSRSHALTVRLKNLEGRELFAQLIPAAAT